MATGNTITSGGKIERRDSSLYSGGSSVFNKNKDPYSYGFVLSVDAGDRSITYRAIEDNLSSKVGKALPLYINNIQLPKPGDVVPILKGPNNTVGEVRSQYERLTYYLNPVTINSNVNDNSSIPSGLNNNGGPSTNFSSYNNNIIGVMSTKISKQDIANNQVIVKNYFKNLGLSKEITAGIMGNIQAECGFNPTEGYDDLNGFTSYGLIQWNAKYFDVKKLASPPQGKSLLEHQLSYITDPSFTRAYTDFQKAVNNTNPLTADTAAYLFAAKVERCYGCTEGIDVYTAGKGHERGTFSPSKRSRYANDFFNRFNDTNDPLYWA
jgi:hypothetical protein